MINHQPSGGVGGRMSSERCSKALRNSLSTLLALVLAFAMATPAQAKVELVNEGPFAWTLGGYARMLGGAQISNADSLLTKTEAEGGLPGFRIPRQAGLAAAVFRLEWGFKFGDIARLDVHNRFFLVGTSESAAGGGGGLGVGVSREPDRTLDMSTVIFQEGGFLLEHDIDRLVLRFFVDKLDLSIGRQAITWGISNLFTVADVWAAFSPFDLDTSQKRGIDSVRAVINLGAAELDVIVADRKHRDCPTCPLDADNLSGGVRAVFYTDVADVYVAAGKFWQDIGLMAGIVAPVDAFKLRLEAHAAYDVENDRFRLPMITAGVDWFATAEFLLTAEFHYNGLGTDDPDNYIHHLSTDATVARGQVYLTGRYYAGLMANWQAHELITLNLTTMMNLVDPSALVAWGFNYSVAQDVDLGLGGFHGVGAGIGFDLASVSPTFGSELGSYGHLVYLQMAAFF